MDIILTLSNELNIKKEQVIQTVKLIDQGNTVPFIARYRKEVTGGLDDVVLRKLFDRLSYLRSLEERRETVKRLITEQGKMTAEISEKLDKATMLRDIEDIYRPFKPKKKTRATEAKRKGLEPLADILLKKDFSGRSFEEIARDYVDPEKEVASTEEAIQGALDIIAETFSDSPSIRKYIRTRMINTAVIKCTKKKDEDSVYAMYYDYEEPVKTIANHRVLAINRGEKEGYLTVDIEADDSRILSGLKLRLLSGEEGEWSEYMERALTDAYYRLIVPALKNEIRTDLLNKAQDKAMEVFSANLKNLLMQAPVKGKVIMGIDPAYRTGCKIAVIDSTGKVLDTAVMYPTPPLKKTEEAKKIMSDLIEKHHPDMIAIGNGTASGETEIFVSEYIRETNSDLVYVIVNEAGASVYSASELGTKEFPDFDVALRSAVSIARRLQDPMAELVKIPPESIGVGQYQHDMNKTKLAQTLKGVVEDCVNRVGVDLNTASASLLSYVAGINKNTADNIVEYREKNGRFTERRQLLDVPQFGEKTFEQCAGFLRISDGENIFDNTGIHPESYEVANKLILRLGYTLDDVKNHHMEDIDKKVEEIGIAALAKEINCGVPTLKDIIEELKNPGRDVREDFPRPVFKRRVMDIKDLVPGQIMEGTVRNITNFGVFVDIGVHQDGLVHISQISDAFVKNPMNVLSVGEIVKVKILDVDHDKKRISLTMKDVQPEE